MASVQFPHSSPDSLQREVLPPAQEADALTEGPTYTKAEANYRPAGTSQTACWSCRHFQRGHPNTCRKVAGPIDPEAVCDLWQAKTYGLGDLVAPPGGGQK